MSSLPPYLHPPNWAASVHAVESLTVVSLRLGASTLDQVEALRQLLGKPSRAVLLRYLLTVGLFAVGEQLKPASNEGPNNCESLFRWAVVSQQLSPEEQG